MERVPLCGRGELGRGGAVNLTPAAGVVTSASPLTAHAATRETTAAGITSLIPGAAAGVVCLHVISAPMLKGMTRQILE